MYLLLISLLVLCIVAFVAGRLLNRRVSPPEAESETKRPAGCCGQHELCEKESLLAAVSREVEYYDDEELDRFRGRSAETYNAEEVEEFQDILFTMKDEEVAGWVRSLQLRGVELPVELKDDVIMIVGERRESAEGTPHAPK